ncbi:MAG: MG2 domain-containing protein, partial [Akkermansiaceae bacterium]|nr:MG2 domain-containing protein [Akkermansiaceae bacterium]
MWKAQNVAVFQPDGLPVMGTTYRFAVTKGHQHLNGDPIPAGEFATAKAEGFGAQTANAPNRWSGDFVPATASWYLHFNDEIAPETAARYIAFFGPGGERVQAKLSAPEYADNTYHSRPRPAWSQRGPQAKQPAAPPATVIVATPAEPLPPLGEWSLIVVHGCPNKSNTARQEDDFRQMIGKIEPFEVASVTPQVSVQAPRRILVGFTQALPDPLPDGLLEKCVTIKPRPASLWAERNGSAVTLRGDFSAANRYEVTISPPLASAAGHPLKTRHRETVEFEYLKPELRLASNDQAQLATGTRAYRVAMVNLAAVRARAKAVTGAEAVRLLGELNRPPQTDPESGEVIPQVIDFDAIPGEPVFDRTLALDNAIDTRGNLTLEWDKLLPPQSRSAVLFLDLAGTPRKELGKTSTLVGQALVQLTDIGLAWKSSRGETLLYAFSCATGKPLPGVKLELTGSAEVLATVTTDATGRAWLPRHERADTLRASLGVDEFLTRFPGGRGEATLDMWRFPVETTWYPIPESMRTVYLFTDRSLYRPGETVRLKGIVRTLRGNTYQLDAPAKARLVVVDPADSEIHSSPVTISPAGSFDFTYTLPTSQTGTHFLRLEYPEELARAAGLDDWRQQEEITSNARFETTIQVEDFRRNTFEVTQSIADPPLAATRVEAAIDARYYQGQPVAGGKVSYQTHITENNPYPDRFRDFLFGNHRSDDWRYWYHYFACRWDLDGDDYHDGPGRENTQNQAEATLDTDGKAAITIPLPESEFPTGRRIAIVSETTDANNQTLTAKAETTVHPASVYVGVSRIDRLVRAGEPLELKLVAVTPDGAPLAADAKVTATLVREVNTSTKVINPDHEATTHNDRREETVATHELTITAADSAGAGAALTLRPPQTGLHFLTVRGTDPDGRPFATVVHFNAYGTKDYPWLYEDTLRVKLLSEKRSYQPGDTARVLVLSPIEGTALVTVEREKVLRSFLLDLKADQPVIEIPVTEDDAPYACVSVVIVKGAADSSRKFKAPQLRAGYCALHVANTRDRLAVDLKASGADLTLTDGHPTFRPGAEVEFAGRITLPDGSPAANAEVTLYAEDEGTLAVMGYLTPDPMKFFHTRRVLQVATGLSFDTFLNEDPASQILYGKGYDVGGGGDLGKLADLLRKNFDPCAMWAPALVTDADGWFRHTAKLPDLLTRYRVIAVAHHQATRFGHHESAIVANKPLMLEPKAPRFANQSDTVTPRLLVQNASDHTGTWRVTYGAHAASGSPVCRALGETVQTVTLAPGKSTNLAFPSVLETTGEAV